MARTHVKVQMGGLAAAGEFYRQAPTPNLIIVESRQSGERLIAELDHLAEVVDAGTKVVVIGHTNDVDLYRRLIGRLLGALRRHALAEFVVAHGLRGACARLHEALRLRAGRPEAERRRYCGEQQSPVSSHCDVSPFDSTMAEADLFHAKWRSIT